MSEAPDLEGGIYVSEVDEVDLGDGPMYRARLKSHPHVTATASTADEALRSLVVIRERMNANRADRGVPPLEPDGYRAVNYRSPRHDGTLLGRLRS